MLARARGRSEDTGTEVKKSGSPESGGETDGPAWEAAIFVEICRLGVAPKAGTFDLVEVLHGDANVEFRDGQRSVVTAAAFCGASGQRIKHGKAQWRMHTSTGTWKAMRAPRSTREQ